jgi:hypothetical protein
VKNDLFSNARRILFVIALLIPIYPAALQAESPGTIPHLSGGYGAEERDALGAREAEYNVSLVFAVQDGDYLGGADVLIKNAKGETVLEATAEGPWFFVRLPQGNYTITASALGKTMRRQVHLTGRGHTRLAFTWNAADSETFASGRMR